MTVANRRIVRTRIALYILSSAALFTWFLYLDERETFTFRWFIDYPGIYLVIAIYALPVIAFQFLAERFLLHSEREPEKTILSVVLGLAAGFFFYLFIATV